MTDPDGPILSAVAVTYGFPQRPAFLRPISLEVRRGQCWGIIGPNGAGKSTLLRLLAGLVSPASGTVRLNGRPLRGVLPRERARQIAFVPQHLPADLSTRAREIVLMGRFPHRRFGLFESESDFGIADRALALMEAASFADRPLGTLSGGEAQRIHIAAAIAQQPAVLLLDEPTSSLDLYHQLSIFSILRTLTDRDRVAVIVVTHDVNLAARFCSHVLLLDDGRPVATGAPAEVIRAEVLEPVYQVELASVSTAPAAGIWVVPIRSRSAPCDRQSAQRGDA